MNLRDESLAKITKDLMFTEPFYGLLLVAMNKTWTTQLETAGVTVTGINFSLAINPDYWDSLNDAQKKGLLKHELMHIAFFHLTDFSHLADRMIANWAMDIEINQYIDPTWLPKGGLLPSTFPHLNLKEKEGTLYYYEKLKELQDEVIQTIKDAIANGELDVTLPDGTNVKLTEHDWSDIENLDEGTQKVIREQSSAIMQDVAEQVEKSRGTLPGEIKQIIEALKNIPPPKFDWRGYMRRFVGKSVKIYTKKSRRKLSKRYEDNPGLKIKQRKHILVAIDTSGSVSKSELVEFLQEIHHIHKTGNDVTIIQCDTAISHVGKYKPGEDYKIHGRGGTSFQPVIDYYNERINKISCLIYFTDGEAPAPIDARGNILWVLSSSSEINESLPGFQIKLDL